MLWRFRSDLGMDHAIRLGNRVTNTLRSEAGDLSEIGIPLTNPLTMSASEATQMGRKLQILTAGYSG